MKPWLALARLIDALNDVAGACARWLILACILISAGNALARYGFNLGSNAWLEIQWSLFSLVFLGAAGYTLKHNGHVRIDLLSSRLSPRAQYRIDLLGHLFMLLPVSAIMLWFGWEAFVESYRIGEMSTDAGGLARWPIKIVVPAAFALLILQGVAETIRKIAKLLETPPREDA